MDLSGFRNRFPEFNTAPDALVSAALAASAGETSADGFGTSYDEAHGLLAAHKLAISPFGQNARMVNDKGGTTYQTERNNVVARMVTPISVI